MGKPLLFCFKFISDILKARTILGSTNLVGEPNSKGEFFMKTKLLKPLIVCMIATVLLSGCTPIQSSGPAAPEIKIERKEFVKQTYLDASAMDCTEVVKFINGINSTLDDDLKIEDYEMFYDKDNSTVFVTSDISTLAFKVDDKGNILFSSCTGSPDTKSIISQSIAKAYNSAFSSDVESLFETVESARWLNSLNSSYVNSAVSGFSLRDINKTLIANQPDAPEMEMYNGFPTITEALDNSKLMDLENYFESPTLDKFWKDVDTTSINSELKEQQESGNSIKDFFNGITVTPPEVERPSLTD